MDDTLSFLPVPDVSVDLTRLENPTTTPTSSFSSSTIGAESNENDLTPDSVTTNKPSSLSTNLSATMVTTSPSTINLTQLPTAFPTIFSTVAFNPVSNVSSPTSIDATESPIEVADQNSSSLSPTVTSSPESQGPSGLSNEQRHRTYFSCPAPKPKIISSYDSNGVPITIEINAPISIVDVDYDFELQMINPDFTVDKSNGIDLQYIESLLPGIESRLGDAVADYLKLHTEDGMDKILCEGYLVDEWRRQRSLIASQSRKESRILREEINDDTTKILSLSSSDKFTIDTFKSCSSLNRDCYVINGYFDAKYVGYNEASVKSTVSRLVRSEMELLSGNSSQVLTSDMGVSHVDGFNYTMKYLGPQNEGDQIVQTVDAPSALFKMEDISDAIPDNVDFTPTPIGIGIIAALSAAFFMACYALFVDSKEEIFEEVEEILDKVNKKCGEKRSDVKCIRLVEDNANESHGYNLDSINLDITDEDNDTMEIQSSHSFGHTSAINHMKKDSESNAKFNMAATTTAIAVSALSQAESLCHKKNIQNKTCLPSAEYLALEIAADVRMISGCHDSQTSADCNISVFNLPDPAGRTGGACTAALLQALYYGKKSSSALSWSEVLIEMRKSLASKGYEQIPLLTSSSVFDVNEPMMIVSSSSGKKRAVLIGINYNGQKGMLLGCHNDVKHINQYLQKVHGFHKKNIILLMDDGKCKEPTYANIIGALKKVAKDSQAGDCVWIHYSGHGGRIHDSSNDESDGFDETIIPLDFLTKGHIRDDDLLNHLVKPMKKGVTLTCVMDCCHSGTVLDLPYRFVGDGEHREMESNEKFNRRYNVEVRIKSCDQVGVNRCTTPSSSCNMTSKSILRDLEISDSALMRSLPHSSNDSYPIYRLPSVPEADLPPPLHDTPSYLLKYPKFTSSSGVLRDSSMSSLSRELNRLRSDFTEDSVEVYHEEQIRGSQFSQDEEYWEV